MSLSIVLTRRARDQLDYLYDYIATAASPNTALRFVDAIYAQFEPLRDFPVAGTARDDIRPGLRTIGFRRRVTIAFMIQPNEVLIVGVFYGGQDFERILADD